jgi:RNA polymerase sigma-70 factor (ECF subfamily)
VDGKIKAMLADSNPQALDLLWEQYAQELRAYLISVLCSVHDAEDTLQDVFVTIARKRQHVARTKHLKSYLYSMSRNTALNKIRKNQRRQDREQRSLSWLEPVDDHEVSENQTAELKTALEALPEKQRTIMMMKHYQDMTFKEIAERLDISENTAASRYRYALDKLKSFMKETPHV